MLSQSELQRELQYAIATVEEWTGIKGKIPENLEVELRFGKTKDPVVEGNIIILQLPQQVCNDSRTIRMALMSELPFFVVRSPKEVDVEEPEKDFFPYVWKQGVIHRLGSAAVNRNTKFGLERAIGENFENNFADFPNMDRVRDYGADAVAKTVVYDTIGVNIGQYTLMQLDMQSFRSLAQQQEPWLDARLAWNNPTQKDKQSFRTIYLRVKELTSQKHGGNTIIKYGLDKGFQDWDKHFSYLIK